MSTGMVETTAKPNGNGVTVQPAAKQIRVVEDHGPFALLLDTAKYEHLWRLAQTFAASTLVPEQFQHNAPNCFIGMQMALRLGVDPFMFLQKCYIVHGRPGIEAQLAIALANNSGRFTGPIRYRLEGKGMERQCTAFATLADCDELVEAVVTMQMAKAEGWIDKKGSKWVTIPDQMLQYRSATFLLRLYAPDVLMGMSMKDELDDMEPAVIHRSGSSVDTLDALTEQLRTTTPAIESKTEPASDTEPAGEATEVKAEEKAPEKTVQPDSPRDALDPLVALRAKLEAEFFPGGVALPKGEAKKRYDAYCGETGTLSDDAAALCSEIYERCTTAPAKGELFQKGQKSAIEAGH